MILSSSMIDGVSAREKATFRRQDFAVALCYILCKSPPKAANQPFLQDAFLKTTNIVSNKDVRVENELRL